MDLVFKTISAMDTPRKMYKWKIHEEYFTIIIIIIIIIIIMVYISQNHLQHSASTNRTTVYPFYKSMQNIQKL
jgi:uncharacterized integral membrane protein